MWPRAQIHQADAVNSYSDGLYESAVGHSLATLGSPGLSAEAAEAARQTIRDAYERLPAPNQAEDPDGYLNRLALKALHGDDVVALDGLANGLITRGQYELALSTTNDFPHFMTDQSLSALSAQHARATAQAVLDGHPIEEAAIIASEAALAPLDAILERNPDDVIARVIRTGRRLNVGRFQSALDDFRVLLKTQKSSSFVYINLCNLLRNVVHPEAEIAANEVVANLSDDPNVMETWYYSLTGIRAVPQAMAILERVTAFKPEYQIAPQLREMADDIDRPPTRVFGKAPSGRHLIYASMVCWGESYLAMMEQISLSSLLAPGNIPAFCAQHDLVIDLVTMPGDVAQVERMAAIHELAKHCEIRIYCFPQIVEDMKAHIPRIAYMPYGFATNLTVQRAARDGADLTFLMPDLVYADGGFAFLATLVTKEPRAFFTDGLNTAAAGMLDALAPYAGESDPSLTISARDLINLSVQHLMPRTTDFYYRPDAEAVMSYPQRVVFREKRGLVVHSFSKMTMYASHAAYAPLPTINYTTPDAQFTEHVLDSLPQKYIHYIDNAEKFLVVELCHDTGRLWPTVETSLITSMEKLFFHFGFHINTFHLFENGVLYPTDRDYSDAYTTVEERAAFLEALETARRTRPVFAELGPIRAKHGRAALTGAPSGPRALSA